MWMQPPNFQAKILGSHTKSISLSKAMYGLYQHLEPGRKLKGEFLLVHSETDNQEKDEKQSQNDKTGLGMEKL
ncbi:hypothetical protein Tco_1402077 [Tanacetum coccineum]